MRRTRCLIPAGADAPVAPVLTAALGWVNGCNCTIDFEISSVAPIDFAKNLVDVIDFDLFLIIF